MAIHGLAPLLASLLESASSDKHLQFYHHVLHYRFSIGELLLSPLYHVFDISPPSVQRCQACYVVVNGPNCKKCGGCATVTYCVSTDLRRQAVYSSTLQSVSCQREHWAVHRLSCGQGIIGGHPPDVTRLLDGAKKFQHRYRGQLGTFAISGMQQIRGWWRGPPESVDALLARYRLASRRVGWQVVIKEKATTDPAAELHHNDMVYVGNSGCIMSLEGVTSAEYREGLIARHEAQNRLAAVIVLRVQDRTGADRSYFTTTIGFAAYALLHNVPATVERDLLLCSARP